MYTICSHVTYYIAAKNSLYMHAIRKIDATLVYTTFNIYLGFYNN